MFFTGTAYIGIDPTAGHKPFSYAALDEELKIMVMGHGSLDEILAFVAGQHQAVVAVSAPRRPSQKLMAKAEIRDRLVPPPHPGRWTDFRLAEYLLRQHRISCTQTPSNEKNCPAWMRMGFQLYQRLESMDFQPYPAPKSALQWLEVYPHASYAALLGLIPLPKHTLEGRMQRQLALFHLHVDLADPMELVQGITRRNLLEGTLPDIHLRDAGELDALVAAYTAWQASKNPDQVSSVGDAAEGLVFLPVAELKRRY